MLYSRALLVALTAIVCFAACSDDGMAEDGCPKVRTCDITRERCQRNLMEAVSCRRGGEAELPRVSVVSEQDYIARLASYDEEDPEAEAEFTLWNRGLALFALAPVDYALADARRDGVAEVGAAYFRDTKEILVIDRGEPLDDERAVMLFAHELVHALQDAQYDLEAWQDTWAGSFDEQLALRAIIEGEATLYQLLVQLELDGIDVKYVNWTKYFSDWQSETLREAELDVAPVELADIRFPYAFGGALIARRYLGEGRASIDRLFEEPLRSTREIMFGARGEDAVDAAATLRAQALPALEGYETRSWSEFGAYLLRIFAAHARVPVAERLEAPRALLADAFTLLHDPETDDVTASWCVHTDSLALSRWPGFPDLTRSSSRPLGSLSAIDLPRETRCYLGSEQFVSDAGHSSWGPLPESDDESANDAESARRALGFHRRRSAIGCARHIPQLRSSDAEP